MIRTYSTCQEFRSRDDIVSEVGVVLRPTMAPARSSLGKARYYKLSILLTNLECTAMTPLSNLRIPRPNPSDNVFLSETLPILLRPYQFYT